MKTKTRCMLLLALVVLWLTACRVVVDTEVQADGSGELRTAVVFSAKEKEDFAQKPENQSKSICANLGNNLPAGATFREEIHDGETYCVTERPFSNLAELRKFYSGMSQVTVNTLQFELGKFTLDLDVDLTGNEAQSLANEWQITMPGEIGAQNADRVEGQTLIWTIPAGQKSHLRAESTVGLNPAILGVAGNILALGIACVIFILVLGGIFLFLRNRRKSTSHS